MITWFRTRAALLSELAELTDTTVTLTAQLEQARRPTPVDWSRLATYFDDADGYMAAVSRDPKAVAYNDQALASWRAACAEMGVDVDDPVQLRALVAGLVAVGSSSREFACYRAGSPGLARVLSDHTVAFLAQAVMTLLQFRPKETG